MKHQLLKIAQDIIRSQIASGDIHEIASGIFVSTSKGAVKTVFREIGNLMTFAEQEQRDLTHAERQDILQKLRRLTKFIEDYQ
jgi:hypothetical protein